MRILPIVYTSILFGKYMGVIFTVKDESQVKSTVQSKWDASSRWSFGPDSAGTDQRRRPSGRHTPTLFPETVFVIISKREFFLKSILSLPVDWALRSTPIEPIAEEINF